MDAPRARSSLAQDAEALYQAATALIRFYQFRDRDSALRFGLTVVQAYAPDCLVTGGGSSLPGLARDLRLDESTTSRIVAGMTRHNLVAWSRPEDDGRGKYSKAGRRAIITALRRLTARSERTAQA